MGLDGQFSVIKTQILAMKPTPKLSIVYHLVAEDEQQRMITASKKPAREVAAFQASLQGRREPTRNSQEKGWTKTEKGTVSTESCSHCGKKGHDREGCFKRIGYPEWWPAKGKGDKPKPKAAMVEAKSCPIPGMTEEQYANFLKLFGGNHDEPIVSNMAGRINTNDDDWVVDTGATDHITHQSHLLDKLLINNNERPVTVPNGESIPVKGKGEITFKGGINIKGVLFVPNFKCNLLSVRKLSKDLYCAVTFFPDFFVIQDLKMRNLIGAGDCHGGLYWMKGIKEERKAMAVTIDA